MIRKFKNLDLRGKNFSNEDLKFAVFTNCIIDESTNFSGSNLRHAVFNNTNIEDAKLIDVIGNGKDIITLTIRARTINITKKYVWIDCVKLEPNDAFDKNKLFLVAKNHEKTIRSEEVIPYAKIIYAIHNISF